MLSHFFLYFWQVGKKISTLREDKSLAQDPRGDQHAGLDSSQTHHIIGLHPYPLRHAMRSPCISPSAKGQVSHSDLQCFHSTSYPRKKRSLVLSEM